MKEQKNVQVGTLSKLEVFNVPDDTVQYVRALFPISLTVFTHFLDSNGFKNLYEGEIDKLMRSHCNYVCVNMTKKCYVLSSSTFKHATVNADEFKEKFMGFLSGEDYGI